MTDIQKKIPVMKNKDIPDCVFGIVFSMYVIE